MKTKATVIVFFSNKGGTGKTKHAIQTANCLGAAGYHVLFIDMDFNDSATKFYITSATEEAAITKNTFEAMKNEGGRLEDFSLETERSGVRFIPSSRYLCDLRGVSERRLSHIAPSANGAYDYVIIDCAPSYDNLSLNAIHAANFIITPVMLDLDNYTAAEFLNGKILSETDKSGCWFLTVTKYIL